MKRILSYLEPYKYKIALGLTIKSSATIIELLLPFLLAYVIDYIIPLNQIRLVIYFGLIMLATALISFLANIYANRYAARISTDAIKDLRYDTYQSILHFSNESIDEFSIPSLISRMSSDTFHIYRMFNVIQRMGIRAPILLIGSIIMMFIIDYQLALVLLALLPLITAVIIIVSKRSLPFYDALQSELDKMVRIVREAIGGIKVIKALAKEDHEKDKYEKSNRAVSSKEKQAGLIVASLNPAMNLLLNLGFVLILYVGSSRVLMGLSNRGTMLAFLSYFTIILNSFLALNRIFLLMSRALASASRLSSVLEKEDEKVILDPNIQISEYHIEFENVSFSYNKQAFDVEDISFKVKRNTSLGIIGATGSGKSTIAQLLMRMYDVDQGQILINGQDIRSVPEKELRRQFGVVLQNDALFSYSIKENIAFGRKLDHDQLMEAAEYAQARDFIEQLHDQYEAKVLRAGANFSGGQKQRMLIARALADNPEIIILDDASSALDYQTDANLRKAIKDSYHATAIIIAQRVASVIHADQILVIDQGKIIGLGTHQELLKTCQPYYELTQLQLGGDHYEL